MNIYSKNIYNHLKKLNLNRGDNICCHADLFSFGISNPNICKYIINNILKIINVNEGTLVMPFYRLSGERNIIKKKFYKKSNSYLYKFFFDNYDVIMSKSIIHAHIGLGKHSKLLTKSMENVSFGTGSDFKLFENKKFKLLLLGCKPNQGATYLHHLEQIHRVPYRRMKKLSFNTHKKIRYNYNIRKNNNFTNNFDIILKYLKNKTNIAELKYGKSYYMSINAIKEVVSTKIKKNKYFLVKKIENN